MSIPPGTRFGSYEVTAALGEGGMGKVYRARDTRLDRDVALKMLPDSFATDPERVMRFEREAKALAALNHPNIAQIYGFDHTTAADGSSVRFLVMEFVNGTDLAERLRQGPLPLTDAIRIAGQIGEALDEAHEKGIVHRDLKPANVMVTAGGRVKVLDFGLATRASDDPGQKETTLGTQSGVVLGTVPYMSPEQVQGLPLDRRTDIFSLGILLHEIVLGERPFRGENAATLMSSILRDDPAPGGAWRLKVPAALSDLIRHCLEKRPADRPPTAAVVVQTLRTLASDAAGVPARPARSVVVLPFANRSGDPDNEYFSDGLTEEVIADLSKVAALRTISRNSTMALKGTSKDTATLARELGVSHLVTGSVRRAGNALRVTAELVDARTDAPIWSDKYSGTLDDVFGIQEEIARKIVAALEVTLTDSEARQVAKRPVANVLAYDCYLRARQEMYGWTPDALARAHRLVDEALAIVGDVPVLLATKGQLHWNEVNANLVSAEAGLALAAGCAERALSIDPNLPQAIYVQGLVAGLRGQPELALPDLYRALELAPGDANILTEVCRFSNSAGLRRHEGLVSRAVEIDPLAPVSSLVVSTHRWLSGRRDEIAAPARRAIEMTPQPSMLHILAGWQIAAAGYREEAAAILHRAGVALQGSVLGAWASFQERALTGDLEGALAHGAATEGALLNEFAAIFVAEAYAVLGRGEDALRWLKLAVGLGFVNYPYLNEHSTMLAPLRHETEVQQVFRDVKDRWQRLIEWELALGPGGE